MKFGFFEHIDHDGTPMSEQYEDRLRLIEIADREGFHAYHLAEHHGTRLGGAPSPALFLAAAAQRSRRLRLGPLVYLLPLYHPLRLIEEVCMLDQISNGRLELGIGRGTAFIEHRLFGLEPDHAEMTARFHEAREILLLGLQNDTLNYRGTYHSFDDVPVVFQPVQRPHPPLWYGTGTPETAAWNVAHDVNVITLGPTSRAQAVGAAYRAEWKASGKDPERMPFLGMTRHMVVADTTSEAHAIGRRAYDDFNAKLRWLWDRSGWGDRFPAHFIEDFDAAMRAGIIFAGTPADTRDYVAKQIADSGGINYLAVGFAYGGMTFEESRRSIELFAHEVMPEFTDVERAGASV